MPLFSLGESSTALPRSARCDDATRSEQVSPGEIPIDGMWVRVISGIPNILAGPANTDDGLMLELVMRDTNPRPDTNPHQSSERTPSPPPTKDEPRTPGQVRPDLQNTPPPISSTSPSTPASVHRPRSRGR